MGYVPNTCSHPSEERSSLGQCLACGEVPVPRKRCDAWHDGHDCSQAGECNRATLAMLVRIEQRREREEEERLAAQTASGTENRAVRPN